MPRPARCGKELLRNRVNDAALVREGACRAGSVALRASVAKRFTAGKRARKKARAGRGRGATPRGVTPATGSGAPLGDA